LDTLTGQIRLDFRSQEPIYLQIVRQVEKLVHDGALKPGDQLPTVRQMAIDLRINFSTVARAYRILDEQRLISTQRGRGTYIWDEGDLDGQSAETSDLPADEDNPNPRASRLVQDFIAEAARQGFSLTELKLAFDHEIAARSGISDGEKTDG
jgi:GntR family transcriptional regulator